MALCPCVCLSICLSHAGIVSKLLKRSNWFSTQRLPSVYHTVCSTGIRVPPKIRATFFPLELCPKLWTNPIFWFFFRHGMSTTASIINLVRTTSTVSSSHCASIHLCLQQAGYDTPRRADSSATTDTCHVVGNENNLRQFPHTNKYAQWHLKNAFSHNCLVGLPRQITRTV